MFQSLAVGGFFLVSLFTLIATPGAPRPSADLAPPAAVQLIADVHSSDEVIPTEPPLLPAPDPFEGMEAFDPVPGGPPPGVRPVLPTPEPPPATWVAGPPLLQGGDILATASALLGVPYVWGGNSTGGMDCSAYVSRAWGLSRQTTDSLHAYSSVITEDQLLPGDAMNLTTRQDPRGYGHIRLFAAWANDEHSLMWVYEETPRQAVYHVIAYDARYTPIRRSRMATEGVTAPLIPAPVAPKRATPVATATRQPSEFARWPHAPPRPRRRRAPRPARPPRRDRSSRSCRSSRRP